MHTYDAVELFDGGAEGCWSAKVVACGEGVAGIEADADSGFVLNLFYDVAEVFKGVANDVSGPCHVLEQGFDGLRLFVRAIESIGDSRKAGLARVGACVAGVEVVELDAQAVAAFEVVDEGVVGLGGFVLLGLCEVDLY